QAAVTSVAYSPGGDRLISGSLDTTARLWDARDGRLLHTLSMQAPGTPSSGHGQLLSVWEIDGKGVELQLRTAGVESAVFSPDGRTVAAADGMGLVRIWEAGNGQELHTLRSGQGFVANLAFSPNGRRLASAGGDRTVKVWNVQTGQELRTYKGHL